MARSESHYGRKLRDPRWQKKRLEIMERDGWACVECGADRITLNVHHTRYLRGCAPWEYPSDMLRTLCERCHEAEHGHVAEAPVLIKRRISHPQFPLCELRIRLEELAIAFGKAPADRLTLLNIAIEAMGGIPAPHELPMDQYVAAGRYLAHKSDGDLLIEWEISTLQGARSRFNQEAAARNLTDEEKALYRAITAREHELKTRRSAPPADL